MASLRARNMGAARPSRGRLGSETPRARPGSRAYHEAPTLPQALEMRPLVAHCHRGLGRLYGRARDREKAREHLTTAATLYREMGMGFYVAQAEADIR